MEALKIPDSDRFQRIYELSKYEFEVLSDRTDQATIIEIKMFPGRSLETKKKFVPVHHPNLKNEPGIDGHDVMIILMEPPHEQLGCARWPTGQ
jgi:hypothetical protein